MADVVHYVCDFLPGDCCTSCHEDHNEFGTNMMEDYLDEGGTCHVFIYCCARDKDRLNEALMRNVIEKSEE